MSITQLLQATQTSQAALAAHCGVSRATVSLLTKRAEWPSTPAVAAKLRANIIQFFMEKNIEHTRITAALASKQNSPEIEMLLPKQTLAAATLAHFKLPSNPFDADITETADVFMSGTLRQTRERLWDAARNAGFVALIGESGSGKSTLREDLHDRIKRENQPIIIIEPYVLAMEGMDKKGATMKSGQIADAIIRTLNPNATPKSTPEGKFNQMKRMLEQSHAAGYKHVLLIEEAHCMPLATLKHLKRYHELKTGFARLIGIILIGQTELGDALNPNNPAVREVVQRCQVFDLPPLGEQVGAFIQHKLARAGVRFDALFDGNIDEALQHKLTRTTNGKKSQTISMCYPLAVQNYLTMTLNYTAMIGMERCTPEIIRDAT